MKTDRLLLFLHIYKTGGMTLRSVLEQNLNYDEFFKCNYVDSFKEKDFKTLPKAKQDKIKVMCGHFEFGIHERLELKKFQYVTLLRNPVDRVISHYFFIKECAEHTLKRHARQMELGEFAASGLHMQSDNGQTRLLSGVGNTVEFGKCTDIHLQAAKENLIKYFSFAGVLERFDEALLLMQKTFALENILYEKHNVTPPGPGKNRVTAKERQKIEKLNRLDIELYKFARGIFEEQIKNTGPSFINTLLGCGRRPPFEKELKNFRALNSSYREAGAYLRQAVLLLREDKQKESKDLLEKLVEGGYPYPDIHSLAFFYLGEITAGAGDKKSKSWYNKSLEFLEKKQFKSEHDIYMIGSIHKKLKNLDAAKKWFQKVIDSAVMRDILGGAYFHLGEIQLWNGFREDALKAFQQTLNYIPQHIKAANYLNEL